MSATLPVPVVPKGRRRSELCRISLDLGSDSTVAYAQRPNQPSVRLDLQQFLFAFAKEPDLLRDADGRPSHRLRSRYALVDTFQPGERLAKRQHPKYGYSEWLPRWHATQPLLDHAEYLNLANPSVDGETTAQDRTRCLVRFIDDRNARFSFARILSNAKIAFQTGAELGHSYVAELPEGGRSEPRPLGPVESIKNQVCLILENFIRPHRALRDADGKPPEWGDCAVVLTVPNTYSPYHRQVLADAVSETLGCAVETISESDAIVFYYLKDVGPDRGLSMEDLQNLDQRYLTIDVGKGTTDLTLMKILYKDTSPLEKQRRGLDPTAPAVKPHVEVQVQTGRPSGGAKVTYTLARFLERQIDAATVRALRSLGNLREDDRQRLQDVDGSPFRLTTKSTQMDVPMDSTVSELLMAFEKVCDWFKRELDLVDGKVSLPEYPGSLAEPARVAQFLADTMQRYVLGRGVMLTAAEVASLQADIERAIRIPTTAETDPSVSRLWTDLERDLAAYVQENVDDVLIDLANDLFDQGDHEVRFNDAVEALKRLTGTTEARVPRQLRTHVVIAGQGSQFKPLRRRLAEVVKRSDLGDLHDQESVKGGKPGAAAGGGKPLVKLVRAAKRFFEDDGGLTTLDPQAHLAVVLSGANLKDGCAKGALTWYSDWPVMENPSRVHGQIILRATNGMEFLVDMDKLNSEGEDHLTNVRLGHLSSGFNIFYRPTRVVRSGPGAAPPLALVGELDDSQWIRVSCRTGGSEQSALLVESSSGQMQGVPSMVYGAKEARDLRAMLWPARLLEAEP